MDFYEDSNGNKILNLNSIFQVGDPVELKTNNGTTLDGKIHSFLIQEHKDKNKSQVVELGVIIRFKNKEIYDKYSFPATVKCNKEIFSTKTINFMELLMRFLIIIYLGLILNLLYKTILI